MLFHCGLIATLSWLWVARPKGTGAEADRPVGVAMVYETNGGEAYFLDNSGASALGQSSSTSPSTEVANSLPSADSMAAATDALLAGLLPETGQTAGDPTQAAGGLGLGDGGAAIGGDGSIPKVKTTVFGIEGEGTRFLYVFDRSESMLGHGGAPLRRAKSELLESLQSLGPVHQFQIVFYNDSPLPLGGLSGGAPKLFNGDERSKETAMRFVRDISADGGTQHVDALRMALNLGPDVIFFLTDADEPRMTSAQLARIARLNRGTIIHAIEFGYGPQGDLDNFLVKLARHGGGTHVYVNVAQLPGAVR